MLELKLERVYARQTRLVPINRTDAGIEIATATEEKIIKADY